MPGRKTTDCISINTRLCKACWECVDACPNDVLRKGNMPFHKHIMIKQADSCNGCGTCAGICPAGAITMIE